MNIVMFPFIAHGHLNPFMELTRQLEQRKGCKITIVHTPLNIRKLKSSLSNSTTKIHLVEIPFCGTDYGLPPNVENTDMVSYEMIVLLMKASEDLQSPFKNLIVHITEQNGSAPVCIISDMFLGWTVEVANELGIYHCVFIAGAGSSMGALFSVSLNAQTCKIAERHGEFLLPDFPEAGIIQQSQLGNDLKFTDGTDFWYSYRIRQFSSCLRSDSILLNSIEGLGETLQF